VLNVGDWVLLCTKQSPLVANTLRRDGTLPTNCGVAAAKAVATPRSLTRKVGNAKWEEDVGGGSAIHSIGNH